MRAALVLAALALAAPAAAQTAGEQSAEEAAAETPEAQRIAELEAQLAAQQEINALLKQRIRTLEGQLAGTDERAPALAAAPPAPPPSAPVPEEAEARALERALVRRGTAVLPPWQAEVAPGFSWSHSGSSGKGTRQDNYAGALDARLGLPGGWMVGAGAPVLYRDVQGRDENAGFGDVRVAVWKSLHVQDETWPSVVASLQYGAPTGEDFSETDVPTGSGFHRLSGSLAAVKTVDPIAFFGSVSYGHAFERSFDGVERRPGDEVGFGFGATLAVTPEVSMTANFDFAFSDEFEVAGSEIPGSSGTFGVFELGAGFLLTRGVFLSVTGGVGITDDSPDVSLGVSLPIRF